ncbi:MAG: GDSL-type esterase/lipase family protein [Longicatena sp.]
MIDVIDFNLQTMHKCKKSEKAIYAMLPFFQDTVLMGDSLAESILDYRLLRKNNVIAKRGRSVDMIDGDMLRVIALQPRIVFMEYGKNDIYRFRGDEEAFIKKYKEQIRRLYAHDITKIYINSIIPMRSDTLAKFGGVTVIARFNDALRAMCEEMNLTFIDNSYLMQWEDDMFEYDGIHPKYPYYPKWLQNIIKVANLKSDE